MTEDHPAKVTERRIEITLLPERKRGPGGHWLGYRAVCDDPNGLAGYGTSLREARLGQSMPGEGDCPVYGDGGDRREA